MLGLRITTHNPFVLFSSSYLIGNKVKFVYAANELIPQECVDVEDMLTEVSYTS